MFSEEIADVKSQPLAWACTPCNFWVPLLRGALGACVIWHDACRLSILRKSVRRPTRQSKLYRAVKIRRDYGNCSRSHHRAGER
jgi:hypothetical protein